MAATGNESGQEWSEYFKPGWLAMRREEAIEPDLPIIDPHHHIWEWLDYDLKAFLADLTGGHNVRATVHLESGLARDPADPPHLRAVGETRFLMGLRDDPLLKQPGAPDVCAGIVGHVDLDGPEALCEEALVAHLEAGKEHFKGVRFNPYSDPVYNWTPGIPPHLSEDPLVRANLKRVAGHGLVCDVMAFHHQLEEIAALARALPNLTIVVNHCGGFLGRAAKHGDYQAAMADWRKGIEAVAREPNTVMKLGGLGSDFFSGNQLHLEPEPPSSEKIAQIYEPFFIPSIEAFGTNRCMFESNYPCDRQQVDYVILWNAFKRLSARLSADEKTDLFSKTASRVYSLG